MLYQVVHGIVLWYGVDALLGGVGRRVADGIVGVCLQNLWSALHNTGSALYQRILRPLERRVKDRKLVVAVESPAE